MNFEEALKHCKEGNATVEEREYVKAQLDEASTVFSVQDDVNDVLVDLDKLHDSSNDREDVWNDVDKSTIKKAKKGLRKMVLIPVIILISAVVAIGTILSGVFGFAANSATKSAKYDRTSCGMFAITEAKRLSQAYSGGQLPDDSNFYIEDIDKQFIYDERNLDKSYYIYEVEINCVHGDDFTIIIDSRTGKVLKSWVD